MIRVFFFFLCFFLTKTTFAHVGSPDVVMEGSAGSYKVLVSVQPPDVIPGIAKVKVYLQNGLANAISIRAVYFYSGDEGAPEPDVMTKVPGQQLQYTGETWLMSSGSSSVQITISGNLGKGEIIVPVVAISTAKKEMPASTGRVLAAFGIFLFILMVTIIGASVSDGLTKRGEQVPVRRKKIRLASMSIAAILTSLVVYGGNAWWQSWANNYKKFMFKPTQASSKVDNRSNELTFTLDTASQRAPNFSYVIADHGKAMHMFIMRIPAMDAFAHLHPQRIDSATFRTILPPLPKGRYLVFGDIVYNTGYTETIKDTFELPQNLTSVSNIDPDDAFAFAIPSDLIDNPQTTDPANTIICGKPGTGVKLKDGSTMIWEGMTNDALEVNKLYSLKFTVLAPDNKPAKLNPYLGMAGHAAIVRSDGNVYIHLHPVGTFSMAAEKNLVKRMEDPQGLYKAPDSKKFYDSVNNSIKYLSTLSDTERNKVLMPQMSMPRQVMQGMEHTNTVEFPYSFPTAGKYRVWVQVKRNGQILTGAFDKVVE